MKVGAETVYCVFRPQVREMVHGRRDGGGSLHGIYRFHRMIHTQMQEIGTDNPHVNVLGTDGTQLLIGFLFLGFCIAGLIVSSVIETQDQDPGDSAEESNAASLSPTSSFSANPSKGVSISPRDKRTGVEQSHN